MTRQAVRSGRWRAAVVALMVAALAPLAPAAQAPQAGATFDAAWRIVRDSHFDRTMNGVDWDAVAAELRPRAAEARSVGQLRAVIREMLARLGQSHFALLPASADDSAEARDLAGTPGFDVRLAGRDVLVVGVDPGSAADAAGIRAGWTLVEIDGTAVHTMLQPLADLLNARALQIEAWRTLHTRLRGPAGSTVDLTFADPANAHVRLALQRRRESGSPVTVGHLPTMFVRVDAYQAATPRGRAAGVIRFNVWMPAVDRPFARAVDELRTAEGIVLDLRGNPGGLAGMLVGISGHFLDERVSLGVMKTREQRDLHFYANPRRVSATGEPVSPYSGPLAILVDGLSGSASECFAGGMQSLGRARVFGQPTMGQALPALFSRLPNGDVLIHAYGDFVTADGTRLEGRGVVPDELVPLSREDLVGGRDPALEAALAWVDAAAGRGKDRGGSHPY